MEINQKCHVKNICRPGFPKLLVNRYPLDTVAGLHVPPKCSDISLKQVVQLLHFCRPLFEIVRACGPQAGRYCSKSWCSLKKVFTLNQIEIFPIHAENQGDL